MKRIRSWTLDDVIEGRDFFTDKPVKIARLLDRVRGDVILAADEGDGWFPTWVGPGGGDSVRLPGRWAMSPELLTLLEAARNFGTRRDDWL